MKNKNNRRFAAISNQGFVLAPIVILMLISLLMILTGSKELHQALLMHQLKLHQNCIFVADQIKEDQPANYSHCPPCLEATGCL